MAVSWNSAGHTVAQTPPAIVLRTTPFRHYAPLAALIGIGVLFIWNGVRGIHGHAITTMSPGGASPRSGRLNSVPKMVKGREAVSLGWFHVVIGASFLIGGGVAIARQIFDF